MEIEEGDMKKLFIVAIIAILILYFLKAFKNYDYRKTFSFKPVITNALDKSAK